jgi:hypothetical protein
MLRAAKFVDESAKDGVPGRSLNPTSIDQAKETCDR